MAPKRAQDNRIISHLFKLFSKTQSDRILVVIWRLALCVKKPRQKCQWIFHRQRTGPSLSKALNCKIFVVCDMLLFSRTLQHVVSQQIFHSNICEAVSPCWQTKNLTHLTMSTRPVNWKHLVTIKSGFDNNLKICDIILLTCALLGTMLKIILKGRLCPDDEQVRSRWKGKNGDISFETSLKELF